jgi:hypothetical protein
MAKRTHAWLVGIHSHNLLKFQGLLARGECKITCGQFGQGGPVKIGCPRAKKSNGSQGFSRNVFFWIGAEVKNEGMSRRQPCRLGK